MIPLLVAVLGVAALLVFVLLEERRRPDVALLLAVGITLLDALLHPHQGEVPVGPFRPSLGGQDVRPVDLIVVLALGARLLVRGLPRRVTGEGLLWSLFFAWYAFAGLVGFVRDQPTDFILFQGKFVLETGGMVVLAAGVPLSRLANRRLVARVAHLGGAIAAVLVPLAAAGVSIPVPGLPRAQLGRIAPDAATMLFTVGVLVLVTAACDRDLRPTVLLGGAAMAMAPFVADQRAALVGAVPAVLVVLVTIGGPVWRRRSRVRVAALVPVAALVLVPIAVAALRSASSGEGIAAVPVVSRVTETFDSEQKQESAEIRVGLLREGRELAAERPVLGQGLGQPVDIFNSGRPDAATSIGDFHNIVVDLAVRTGMPGVALLVLAVGATLLAAQRRWTFSVSDLHAALVLAAGAALAGLLMKGMFETIFQKYRLAVFLGLLIGLVAAGGRTADRAPSAREEVPAWT